MKVLLVDDHPVFRDGVALLLQRLDAQVEVVQAGSCQQALDLVERHIDAELVLMDLGLPDRSGFEAIAAIRSHYPDKPVVVLSSNEDKESVMKALDQGAMGFIPKTSSSDVLVAALKLVMSKGIYLPPSVFLGESAGPHGTVGTTVPASAPRKTPSDLGLTERQADVLYLILQGRSSKLICRELELSASTVKTHTSAVLRALNVTTRTQAIVAAGRLGLTFDKRTGPSAVA